MQRFLVFFFATFSLVCGFQLVAQPKVMPDYQIETLVSGLDTPWSLAFLGDDDMLVSLRSGALVRVKNGQVSAPIGNLPDDIYVQGQGGLQDVVLHPDYAENGWLYLSYASGTPKKNALKVIRGRLREMQLVDVETVFTVAPFKDTPVHYGARMTFLPDNTLLITTGDGFDYREDAQRLDNLLGKVIRVNADGSIPANNPFATAEGLRRYVFSYGHRNPQGIVYDAARQRVFSHEHGPAGGDEINVLHGGNNYGWPVVTNGRDYSGASITPFKTYPGMELPFVDWTPSIAPAGMALYLGEMFAMMQGDLLVSTLKSQEVRWVQMDDMKVVAQVSLFKELGQRVRDVRVHNGIIYLVTDGRDGKILRVTRQ